MGGGGGRARKRVSAIGSQQGHSERLGWTVRGGGWRWKEPRRKGASWGKWGFEDFQGDQGAGELPLGKKCKEGAWQESKQIG